MSKLLSYIDFHQPLPPQQCTPSKDLLNLNDTRRSNSASGTCFASRAILRAEKQADESIDSAMDI